MNIVANPKLSPEQNTQLNSFIDKCFHTIYRDLNEVWNADIEMYQVAANWCEAYESVDAITGRCRQISAFVQDISQQFFAFDTKVIDTLITSITTILLEFEGRIVDGFLIIPIKNVSLTSDYDDESKYDFGDYDIYLPPYSPIEKSIASYNVITLNPEHTNRNNYTHPHVYSNGLCMGAGVVGIKKALQRGDIVSFYLLVDAIMHNYNPEGAYKSIAYWTHIGECVVCGASDADMACDDCNANICTDCYSSCTDCGNVLCDSCGVHCSNCGITQCASCSSQCRCHECHSFFCDECTVQCRTCGHNFCTNCIATTCNDCGDHICADCCVTCSECDAMICDGCAHTESVHPNQLPLFEGVDGAKKIFCEECWSEKQLGANNA